MHDKSTKIDVLTEMMNGLTPHCTDTEFDKLVYVYNVFRKHIFASHRADAVVLQECHSAIQMWALRIPELTNDLRCILNICTRTKDPDSFCILGYFVTATFLSNLYECSILDVPTIP